MSRAGKKGFLMICVPFLRSPLELDLEAAEKDFLVLAVAGGEPTVVLRALVVEEQPHVAVQVPVEARRQGLLRADGARRIGEDGEGRGIDVELAEAHLHLPGAPGVRRR